MADRFGAKTIFLSAIAIFTLASVLCGISNDLVEFTAARIVQGIGGAMMVPVGRLMILRSTEKTQLVNMMQFFVTPGLIAPILGPPVGGFITTFSSWRWIFFLNVPLGLLALVLVATFMVNHKTAAARSFDTPGFILSGAGLASFLFGVDQLGRPSIDPVLTAGLIGSGIVVSALAVLHLRRTAHPLLDLSTLRVPTFAVTVLWGSATRESAVEGRALSAAFAVSDRLRRVSPSTPACCCWPWVVGNLGMKSFTTRILKRSASGQ